tara:strand:+ start:182 stop:1057 length:876 start_codon:yes stop_codon:yes gene_type:complete
MLLFIICSFSVALALNDYDNIYNVKSNPRNIAIGNMHITSNSINNIFDSPIIINSKKNLSISLSKLNPNMKIIHLAYCLKYNDKMNISFGIARREIKNNYGTNLAWENDGYPDLEEINYNMIYGFNDKETGFLFSYNKVNDKSIIGINFKPLYHSIGKSYAIGYQMDIRYVFNFTNFQISLGIDNLISQKKWNYGLVEKFNLDGYLNISFLKFKKTSLFYEIDNYLDSKLGLEYRIVEKISIRTGIFDSNFAFGLGFNLNNIDFDYTYISNHYDVLGDRHIVGFVIKLNNF